jgi:hypothetical protein
MVSALPPDPLAHYAELRKLLIQHAEHLTKGIDIRAETTGANHRGQVPANTSRLNFEPSGPGSLGAQAR